MNLLITGASGIVASDLIKFFLKKQFKIIALYRNNKKDLKKIKHKNLICKKLDLRNEVKIKKKIDVIIHCAVVHEFSQKKGLNDYINSNIKSLSNLINYAQKSDVKLIINFSTVTVYGLVNQKLLKENYRPQNQNILGVTKILAEKLLFSQNINFINIRMPGILCSNKRLKRPWIQTVINKIKNGNKLKVFNANNYFNNVTDTEDIFRFLIFIIKKKITIKDTFNFSAIKPIKVYDIINKIKKQYNSKSKIQYLKDKKKSSFTISTNKIYKKLKFSPSTTNQIILRNL